MRIILISFVFFIISVSGFCVSVKKEISGTIGKDRLSIKSNEILGITKFSVPKNSLYIAITETYPENKDYIAEYDVKIPNNKDYYRKSTSKGFGNITYFIKLKSPFNEGKISISSKSKVFIYAVNGVTQKDLDNLKSSDRFIISGMITPDSYEKGPMEGAVEQLMDIKDFPKEYNILKGISTEVRFAAMPDDVLKKLIGFMKDFKEKYDLKVIMGIVSWWAGTPLLSHDSDGIPFGDVKYQQICYNPDMEFPYDLELEKLLGDRYNNHYRKTIPNIWSNTPWLTMNNKELNNFKFSKMSNVFKIMKELDGNNWIDCFFVENEPKYWDMITDNSEINDVRLWADFNPNTVADAKLDGITLDPEDDLSKEELLWLHANVAKYNQLFADSMNKIIKETGFTDKNIYSHTLYQGFNVFPCNMLDNKPACEWGYVKGARTGLESCCIPMVPSNIYRVREWGNWTNLNREENDGMPIELHLWDLRVTYLCGADYYNSYNWNFINQGAFVGYVNDFNNDFPVVTRQIRNVIPIDEHKTFDYKLWMPMDLLAFNKINLKVFAKNEVEAEMTLAFSKENGDVVKVFLSEKLKVGENLLQIEIPTMFDCNYNEELYFQLEAKDTKGNNITKDIYLPENMIENINMSLDVHEQRLLSLYSIENGALKND